MRLLIVNFAMDQASPVLAWQHTVACCLAAVCERVVVITEHQGVCDIPSNLTVYAVPKCFQRFPLRWIKAKWLMLVYLTMLCEREKFESCFIHMAHEWSYRYFSVLKYFQVPILLWYAHGSVTSRLRLSLACVDRVVTSTSEGFRIRSPKVRVIGQGIDTKLFRLRNSRGPSSTVIYVGRISKRKRVDLIIEAMGALVAEFPKISWKLLLVGAAHNSQDSAYQTTLEERADRLGIGDRVDFVGARFHWELPSLYESVFVHVNLSETGSMDKTVMESLAVGCPVLTSNEAIIPILDGDVRFVVTDTTPRSVASKIYNLFCTQKSIDPMYLRSKVVGQHDLNSYIKKIITNLQSLRLPPQSPHAGGEAYNEKKS
jgi:glycosyltransferase involved in cell wall biosynthesis